MRAGRGGARRRLRSPGSRPRGPGRAAALGGLAAGRRSALPAATLAGAKGRRQASQRMRSSRGQRAGAMAALGAAGARSRRGSTRLRWRPLLGRAAPGERGGAGATLARPRLGTLCRCAPPPRRPLPTSPAQRPLLAPSLPWPHPASPHDPPRARSSAPPSSFPWPHLSSLLDAPLPFRSQLLQSAPPPLPRPCPRRPL